MEDLAANRGDSARLAKGARRASKRAAADVLAAMNGAAGRVISVAVPRRGRVVLDTLSQRVIYRHLAAVLAGGVQAHLAASPLLEAALGLEAVPDGGWAACGGAAAWRGGDKATKVDARARHKASSARMAVHAALD